MLRTKTILGTLLTLTAAATSVYLSFGSISWLFQALNAVAVAALVACPVIFWRRESARLRASESQDSADSNVGLYEGPSDTAVATTLTIATLCLALVLLSPSRWPATIAFGSVYALMALLVLPRRPLRSLFVALAATLSLWPVEPDFASRIETRLTTYLASLASDRLDSHSILNVPEGRTLRTIGGNVTVGTVEGRMPALRFGAVAGAVLAVFLKRSFLHVLLMTFSGWFWAIVLTGFHYYGISSRQNSGGFVEGLWGQSWFVFLIGMILLVSTDQLWLVLGIFNPFSWFSRDRKRSSRNASGTETTKDAEIPEIEEEEPEPRSLPSAVFLGIGAVAMTIAVLDVGLTFQHHRQNKLLTDQWRKVAESNDRGFFPDRLGRWVKTDRKSLMDTSVPARGAVTVSAYYLAGENFARVSYLGTFGGWYDRYIDFQSAGWREGSQRVINDPTRGLSYVFSEFSLPTGEHCTLIYQMKAMDDREDGLMEASTRSYKQLLLWEMFQSMFFRKSWKKEYYLTEIAFESYGPLTTSDSQLLDELAQATFESIPPAKLRSVE